MASWLVGSFSPPPSRRWSGEGVGWGGAAAKQGGREAEAEAVAGCRGSGRYLVNDYSLARRRCQAWNTRSCLRCSACCCCRLPVTAPGSGCGAWTQFRSLSLPCIRGNAEPWDGIAPRVSLQLWLRKQFRPARGQHRRILRMRRNGASARSSRRLALCHVAINSELIRGWRKGEEYGG